MALINGNDYDHIDFTKNGVTTRHMLKDALSRQMSGDLVKVQNEEPTSEGTKIWIKPSGDSEVQVPTYEEFEELSDKIDDADATIESLAVSAQPTVSVTEVDGHKRFSFGIPASNGIASITKTATDGVIDTYTIAMTDGTSTSFSVNNSDITPESMAEAIATALQDYARIDGYYPDLTAGNADQLNSTKFVENKEPYLYRPSGGTSDIGNRKYLDAIVGVSLPWNQMVRDEASENSTDFADIVTVTDAVEDAAGVRVQINPVQDLHGYDHPWPAGGGVNLFDIDNIRSVSGAYGLTTSIDGDVVRISGTYTGSGSSSYRIIYHNQPLIEDARFAVFRLDTNSIRVFLRYASTSDNAIVVELKDVTPNTDIDVRFRFVMYTGTTIPTAYSPYSNICPISGFDGLTVTRTGKNLLNVAELAMESSGYNRYFPLKLKKGTYTMSCQNRLAIGGTGSSCRVSIVNSTKNQIKAISPNYGYSNAYKSFSFIITDSEADQMAYLVFEPVASGTTFSDIEPMQNMVELGSNATDYEPYQGETYEVEFPTEAGTVYGGELTVNADGSGSLVVDRKGVVYDGSNDEAWAGLVNLPWRYSVIVNDIKLGDAVSFYVTSNLMKTAASHWSNANYGILNNMNSIVVGYPPANNDVAAFRAFLSSNPLQVVYLLATPITYTLTASEIRTLLGQNHIWSDAGQTALTYTGTDEHLTLESGKKYLARISGTDSMLLGSGQEITAVKGTDNVFDLTKMFGTSVADYVYNQGAGYFRQWFGKTWYPYNTGELKHVEGLESHDVVGFNLFDEEWEFGGIDSTGTPVSLANRIRSVHYITILPNTTYHCTLFDSTFVIYRYFYDADKNFISGTYFRTASSNVVTPENAHYVRFWIWKSAWNDYDHPPKVCFNLSHSEARDGEYELYEKQSHLLDNTVILRGVPKVDSNGVYWDGDRYLPDGTVERKYGVVDLGTLTWSKDGNLFKAWFDNSAIGLGSVGLRNVVCSKYPLATTGIELYQGRIDKAFLVNATYISSNKGIFIRDTSYDTAAAFKSAMSGVMLVYELAEPTIEQATPYRNFQLVDDWGTEEFVTTGMIPVGHESRYPANLRDKLQHLPDAASSNGSYLITQTDGQMTLTPFPAPPTTAGKYALRATVTNGVATFAWEATT